MPAVNKKNKVHKQKHAEKNLNENGPIKKKNKKSKDGKEFIKLEKPKLNEDEQKLFVVEQMDTGSPPKKQKKKKNKNKENGGKSEPVVSGQIAKKKSKKSEEKQKKQKKPKKFNLPPVNRGLVLIKNIPHGFYEQQMRQYFTQFGDVTRVRVVRSPKSGMSRGYAYIEFKIPEVAEVCAETMDGYLMYKKCLKAINIPPEQQKHNYFLTSVRHVYDEKTEQVKLTSKAIEKRQTFINKYNEHVSEEIMQQRIKKAQDKIQELKTKYEALGITVDPVIFTKAVMTDPEINQEHKIESTTKKSQKAAKSAKKAEPSIIDLVTKELEDESDDEDFEIQDVEDEDVSEEETDDEVEEEVEEEDSKTKVDSLFAKVLDEDNDDDSSDDSDLDINENMEELSEEDSALLVDENIENSDDGDQGTEDDSENDDDDDEEDPDGSDDESDANSDEQEPSPVKLSKDKNFKQLLKKKELGGIQKSSKPNKSIETKFKNNKMFANEIKSFVNKNKSELVGKPIQKTNIKRPKFH